MEPRPKVALIAGPTASGKSALALALAERHGGTVINADSAQVYRDLGIVTARPSPEDERRAPHRLFGHVDAADTGYSAARWATEAEAAIDAAAATGSLPILVGGTGLYLRTLVDGIAPVPPIDPAIRAAVRSIPVAEAHAALAKTDPAQAALLNPADTTRVARALEVVRSTGRPIADWQRTRIGGIGERIDLAPLILLPPRDWLDARCDARVETMLGGGAIEEVAALLDRGDIAEDASIRRAIGVPQIAALLSGRATLAEVGQALALATRQYAKRQYTWFRNQPPADWLRCNAIDDAERIIMIERSLSRRAE